jgi:superfamily II DNA or RNA helicase
MDTKEIARLIDNAEGQLEKLDAEREKVSAELEELRHKQNSEFQVRESTSLFLYASINKDTSSAEKIALYRSLFRGREDIYARRWESLRSGKTGYQPACRNVWVKGICRKPEIKCGECVARDFLPLTDSVIRNHLKGFDTENSHHSISRREFVVGAYPLLSDNTCYFLAADFDKESWREDIAGFKEVCEENNISVAVERSRSGIGAHAWIFFSEPIPALMARRFGSFLLTETLDKRPEIGFDSYDRLFPSQDFLPEGGFGSLIALPLQAKPREKGNTVFVDESFAPYPDQWAFLSTVNRVSRKEIERIVKKASRDGKIIGARISVVEEKEEKPWKTVSARWGKELKILGSLPKKVNLVLGNLVYIQKKGLSPAFRNRLIHLAAFQNPEFYKAQAMRFSTFGKPRVISCAEDFPKYIGLPRGCLEEVLEVSKSLGVKVSVKDERTTGIPIKVDFAGTLRQEQMESVEKLLAHDVGVLAAATAFGKTVVAAKIIAERAVNTLILVHRRQLFDQWRIQLAEFLDLESEKIGMIGAGKRQPTGFIDIAIIQSLRRKGRVDDLVGNYGQVIIDECHHISANSFEQVARKCNAKYVLGLSATVTRKDGHHPIIFMQCGPTRFCVTARQGAATHPFSHHVIFHETGFSMPQCFEDRDPTIHEIYEALIKDDARNHRIFEDIVKSIAEEKRSPLLISERREHVDMFAEKFLPFIKNVMVFRGGMGRKQRQALNEQLESIPDKEERLLIATGRYLGEGFDDARLDTLFLALPVSWRGTLAQYAGRLHRLHYNKKEVRIYDYADLQVPLLEKMYNRRRRGYRSIGYSIS